MKRLEGEVYLRAVEDEYEEHWPDEPASEGEAKHSADEPRISVTYRRVEKSKPEPAADAELIQYGESYVYKPAIKAKPKPVDEADLMRLGDSYVYKPRVEVERVVKERTPPKSRRERYPHRIWHGRTKAEVQEDKQIIAERLAARGPRDLKDEDAVWIVLPDDSREARPYGSVKDMAGQWKQDKSNPAQWLFVTAK